MLQGYQDVILTPNAIEFKRLWQAYFDSEPPTINAIEEGVSWRNINEPGLQPAVQLSRCMGVYLFMKGSVDIICNGHQIMCVGTPGSQKRCGGQGDILSGVIGTTIANARRNNCEILPALALAATIVRKSGNIAFNKNQRGLAAPDIIKALPKALTEILGNYNL